MGLVGRIITPIMVGSGVGFMLFADKSQLPPLAFAACVPFWPVVIMPSGILWKMKVLNTINKGEFPAEMKNYRELFLYHRKAIVYELFLNQIGYHSIIGLTFLVYTYATRMLYDKEASRRPFGSFFTSSLTGFFKLRAFFTVMSLLTEFWGSKLSLMKGPDGNIFMHPNSARILFMKQTILNIFWMTSVAALAHDNFINAAEPVTEKH